MATITVGTGGGVDHNNIQDAINAANAGDTITIEDGTYTLTATLNVDKDVTIIGESEAGVIIDASGIDGYGIHLTGDGATLSTFTLKGPAAGGASGNYGIKADPGSSVATDALTGITIDQVTVSGSLRSEIDLNGVDNSTLSNITANGNGTGGVGIALTDSTGITLENIATTGNGWGSIALYTTGTFFEPGTDDVTFLGTYSHDEPIGIFSQDESGIADLGTVNFPPSFTSDGDGVYQVTNDSFRLPGGDSDTFTFFFGNEADAVEFARGLASPHRSIVAAPDGDLIAFDDITLPGSSGDLTLLDAATDTQIFDDMALGPIADGENGWKFAGPVVDQNVINQGGGDHAFRISSDPANGTFGGPYSPELSVAAGEPGLSDLQGQSIKFTLQAVNPAVDGSRLEIDFANAAGTDRNNFMVVESTGSGLRIAVNEPLPTALGDWQNNDFSAFTGNITLASGIDQTVAHQIELRLNYVDGSDNDTIDIYVDGELIGSTTTFENYREFHLGQDHDVAAAANLTSRVLFRVGNGGQPQDGPGGQNQGFDIDDLSNSVYTNATGTGNAGANVIKGNSGDNALFGLAGADTLRGNVGNDALDGGTETDTAAFASSLGAGNFSFVGGQWVVTTTGTEGKDTLNDIEKVTHAGANKFLLVGGNGYVNVAAAEADQQAGDIILTPSTPVVGATAPANLVEAAAGPGTSSATSTITMSDPVGTVDYDFVELVGWSNEGGGIFTKAGTLGTATLNTNTDTLTFALNNAAADSLSAADHPTEQFEIPVINQFGVKSSTVVTFTIDGANDAPAEPTDTNAAANSVAEDALNNDSVGLTVHSTDAESDTLTYSLTDDAGGRFKINATTGVVSVLDRTKLDFETAASHAITVSVSDGNGGVVVRNFTINILDAEGNTINGSGAADTISGTSAPSVQADGFATSENDTIFAGGGNDTVSSLAGKDLVNGGAGNDSIRGGDDADRLNGGIGTDTASYAGSDAGVTVDLRVTTAQSGGDAQGDRLIAIENVTGSNFGDKLIGNASSNILRGAGGDDDLRGGNGDDKLVGGVGNDSLRGNAGSDTFFFATGFDADTVHDYAAGVDEFNFRGTSIVRYSQLQSHMTEDSGDVVINLGNGDKLTILDTTIAILNSNANDFHF